MCGAGEAGLSGMTSRSGSQVTMWYYNTTAENPLTRLVTPP